MKKNKEFLYLVLAILCVWVPIFMGAWDKDKPASSTSLRSSNPEILANWSALEDALAQDHEFSTGGTNSGKHEVLTMEEESSAGASSTNEGHLQVIDGGSQPELAFTSEDGDELQMTKGGDLYSSDNLVVDGASTLTGAVTANGGITLGAGDSLVGSATSNIDLNSNTWNAQGSSGDTYIGGTLDVVGNIDPTTFETTRGGFLDEDNMASNSANKVASQQSIKAFGTWVPAVTGAGAGYAGEESITFPNGVVMKVGVDARSAATTSISFEVAFDNGVLAVQVTGERNSAANDFTPVINSITTSGFDILSNSPITNYHWTVVGY